MEGNEPNELLAGVGVRIRQVRGDRSQEDFADALSVSLSTLKRYENEGRWPDAEFLTMLHIREAISPLWVLRGIGSRHAVSAEGDLYAIREGSPIRVRINDRDFTVDPSEYRWIPFYDVNIAAGGGRVVDFFAPPSKFSAYRKEWLESQGLLNADLFEGTVVGDSGEPLIRNGSIILVNASDKTITSGEVYVVRIGEEFICKHLQRLPDGKIEVSSVNSAVHRPFQIREGELGDSVLIVGRVVPQRRY